MLVCEACSSHGTILERPKAQDSYARPGKNYGSSYGVGESGRNYGNSGQGQSSGSYGNYGSQQQGSNYDTQTKEYDTVALVKGYGELLRHAREKKGLTIQEVAEKMFEKESFLHKIESGKAVPDDKLTKKLENFFGVSLSEKYKVTKTAEASGAKAVTLADMLEEKLKKKEAEQ